MKKILIVEDDLDLQEGLVFSLENKGYILDTANDYQSGYNKIHHNVFNLVLLDCNLPGGNGFDLCQEIRKCSEAAILMLTARDTELDEIKALELGVDDFMTKPFSLGVLFARIKNLIRRKEYGDIIISNGLTINKKERTVKNVDMEISLTSLEFKFFVYLVENKNQVISKEQLLNHIWDCNGNYVDENIVSVYIRRLRKKVEIDSNTPRYIKTVHGAGYVWSETI